MLLVYLLTDFDAQGIRRRIVVAVSDANWSQRVDDARVTAVQNQR